MSARNGSKMCLYIGDEEHSGYPHLSDLWGKERAGEVTQPELLSGS